MFFPKARRLFEDPDIPIEGFGKSKQDEWVALVETRLAMNRYSIFIMDIGPKGFETITMNGLITREVVTQVQHIIHSDEHRREMVDHNYDLGRMFFSYSVLRRKLRTLITNFTGMDDL